MDDPRSKILGRRARFLKAAIAGSSLAATAAGCSPCLSIERPVDSFSIPDAGFDAPAPVAEAAAAAQPIRPADFTFDGIRLGATTLREATAKKPFSEICDDDPIDNRSTRLLVYGAKPCKEHTFPESTSVLLFAKWADGANKYEVPIDAIAWLGGDYFNSRSTFPLRVAHARERIDETLGAVTQEITVKRGDRTFRARRHAGGFWTFLDGERVVGFVAGEMPADGTREPWRAIAQMYVRYTALD